MPQPRPSLRWYQFRTILLVFPSTIFTIMTDQVDIETSFANLLNLFIILTCIIREKEEHFFRICAIFLILIALKHAYRLSGLAISGQLINIDPMINFQNFIALMGIPFNAFFAWHLHSYWLRKMQQRQEPLL